MKAMTKQQRRMRRHARVRARMSGTAQRPRLAVHRSLTSMYAQLIDDTTGTTLVGVHSKHVAAADAGDRSGKVAQAYAVGQKIAELAQAKQISSVVFDRGGFLFQGRVKAVADGARDGGLQF